MKLSTQIGFMISGGVLAVITMVAFFIASTFGSFTFSWGSLMGLNFAMVGMLGFVILMDLMYFALLFYALAAKKPR